MHVGARARGRRRPVGTRSRVHAKAHRRKVPMRKDNFSPEPSGRVGGDVSRQRPSRATDVVRQAGSVAGKALGIGRPVGPESQESLPPTRAVLQGAGFLETVAVC